MWYKEGGYLLFSAIRSNRRMKWAPQEGVTLFREPTDNANGLTRDLQGRLIACESSSRRMSRLEADGSITVVADRYEGKRLNSPNDVVVKSDGSIYFTDPGMDTGLDLDFAGVYRVSADLSAVTLLVRDFVIPNGLVFSPDESILYINDSVGALDRRPDDMFHSIGHIRAFDVQADGTLANGRVFCEMRGGAVWYPRRHEGGCGREHVLHGTGRCMGHRSLRQAPGDHFDWGTADDQLRLGW